MTKLTVDIDAMLAQARAGEYEGDYSLAIHDLGWIVTEHDALATKLQAVEGERGNGQGKEKSVSKLRADQIMDWDASYAKAIRDRDDLRNDLSVMTVAYDQACETLRENAVTIGMLDKRIETLTAERDELLMRLEQQNTDGCGSKTVAEDALKLVREYFEDGIIWFEVEHGDGDAKADNWLARARAALGEPEAKK